MHSWPEVGGRRRWVSILWQYSEPGFRSKEIEVETLSETQEEVETGGARVMKGLRGGVALHSVLLCSAIDTQLCPNSPLSPPLLCQDYNGEVMGHRDTGKKERDKNVQCNFLTL